MRCPDCNKFVSYNTDDEPEEQDNDFDETSGEYNLNYRIVNTCADCGTELKEATFDFNGCVPEDILKQHSDHDNEVAGENPQHPFEMDVDVSRDERSEGKGRGLKMFYGMTAEVTIRCSCQQAGDDPIHQESFGEFCQASSMDELV